MNTKREAKWVLPSEEISRMASSLSKEWEIDPLLCKLLLNRGITTKEAAQLFLYPSLENMHNPFLMKGMDRAVSRIISALKKGEQLCIYGDFDVDGITSTSLLFLFLQDIGCSTLYYIPERLSEGYGLNKEALLKLHGKGVDLVITVDCGISATEEVLAAKRIGMDIIVTDHHQPPADPPDAYAIINPHQKGCKYPCKSLSGVGVVYKLIKAVKMRLRKDSEFNGQLPNLMQYLDLVTIGSVADIVPLIDENRIFVKYGLAVLKDPSRPGISELKIVSGLSRKEVTTFDVGFLLAPRINAAGRVANPRLGVQLLTSMDRTESVKIANELNHSNFSRKEMQERCYSEAKDQIYADRIHNTKEAIILYSEDWHPGIIGIVASRLCEEFYMPAILITFEGDSGRGSARSILGYNIYEGLKSCSHLLEKFGGHKMAAGLSIKRENLEDFIVSFNDDVTTAVTGRDLCPKISIDHCIPLIEITAKWIMSLKVLEPYGHHNPAPVLMSKNIWINHFSFMGRKNNHIRLIVSDGTGELEAIGFNMSFIAQRIKYNSGPVDIVYSPQIHRWNDSYKVQLVLKDLRRTEE